MTTEQAIENSRRTASFGTLGFAHGFEYYVRAGNVFRANQANPVDIYGYRQGGRFECPLSRWKGLPC